MNLSNFDFAVYLTAWPLLAAANLIFLWRRQYDLSWIIAAGTLALFVFGDTVNIIVYLHDRNWGESAFWTAALLYALWVLRGYWRHKRRKKITEMLGAKSRALRDKLVEKTREAMPHPPPVPVRVRA